MTDYCDRCGIVINEIENLLEINCEVRELELYLPYQFCRTCGKLIFNGLNNKNEQELFKSLIKIKECSDKRTGGKKNGQ